MKTVLLIFVLVISTSYLIAQYSTTDKGEYQKYIIWKTDLENAKDEVDTWSLYNTISYVLGIGIVAAIFASTDETSIKIGSIIGGGGIVFFFNNAYQNKKQRYLNLQHEGQVNNWIIAPPMPPSTQPSLKSDKIVDYQDNETLDNLEKDLNTLKGLLDKGLLTEKEYEEKRSELISRYSGNEPSK